MTKNTLLSTCELLWKSIIPQSSFTVSCHVLQLARHANVQDLFVHSHLDTFSSNTVVRYGTMPHLSCHIWLLLLMLICNFSEARYFHLYYPKKNVFFIYGYLFLFFIFFIIYKRMYTSHREATVSESTLLYRHDCFDCVVNSWLLQIWLRDDFLYIHRFF